MERIGGVDVQVSFSVCRHVMKQLLRHFEDNLQCSVHLDCSLTDYFPSFLFRSSADFTLFFRLLSAVGDCCTSSSALEAVKEAFYGRGPSEEVGGKDFIKFVDLI